MIFHGSSTELNGALARAFAGFKGGRPRHLGPLGGIHLERERVDGANSEFPLLRRCQIVELLRERDI